MNRPNRNRQMINPSGWNWTAVETKWGAFGAVMDEAGRVCFTFLPQSETQLRRLIRKRFPAVREVATKQLAFVRQVRDYFAGKRVAWDVELNLDDIDGFRRRVLDACRKIPYGSTATYADLARAAGSSGAARAAGSTMANNPLPLIIPCHRVLRSDGSLGGFSSPQGPSQKERMLLLEDPGFAPKIGAASRARKGRAAPTMAVAFA